MNIQKMMKEAQKMQQKLLEKQEELAGKTVDISVGGGRVSVTANGSGEVLAIKISKEVVDPNDVEMLEDLVLSGVKQAITAGKKMAESELGQLTSGMGLPPGLGF